MPKQIANEQDWIRLGLHHFSIGGEQALVVEQLAKLLGSSKTSFYWYFKSRAGFVKRIVEHWRELATTSIIGHIESNRELLPAEQISALLTQMFSSVQGRNVMHHLRELAHQQPEYKIMLQETEEQRLAYMASLLQRIGYAQEEAERMSHILYHYYLGWYERFKHDTLTEGETAAQVALLLELVRTQNR